jgi:NADH-quinone oxidoreductase subunit J
MSFNLIFICILVFAVDNPVHSVLSLILAFFNAAIILLLFDVEFLGIVFIIIYVGAIAILFLFVVMMLNVKIFSFDLTQYYLLLFSFFTIFSIQVLTIVFKTFPQLESQSTYSIIPSFYFDTLNNLNLIGQVLYNYYASCFLLAGLVLLVAMIGAISLTLNFTSKRKTELLYKQLARSENSISFFS